MSSSIVEPEKLKVINTSSLSLAMATKLVQIVLSSGKTQHVRGRLDYPRRTDFPAGKGVLLMETEDAQVMCRTFKHHWTFRVAQNLKK